MQASPAANTMINTPEAFALVRWVSFCKTAPRMEGPPCAVRSPLTKIFFQYSVNNFKAQLIEIAVDFRHDKLNHYRACLSKRVRIPIAARS